MKNDYLNITGRLLLVLLLLWGCGRQSGEDGQLFTLLSSDRTGIDFENHPQFNREFNILKYRNFYNGGGVAIGDVNNDGLPDVYLTANSGPNKLYLNRGDFEFDEVTEQAGVAGSRGWSTGVSLADVNADGWLDIYVSNSGVIEGDDRQNELFINNGNGTFTEQAETYGLADHGYSIHAAFFDYDRDGDLDAYILNNASDPSDQLGPEMNKRTVRDPLGGDKLMRNEDGRFRDVSAGAGIFGSIIGRGLDVSVSDLDKDGWLDLYISNDFFERDYIYMNNGDGTFRETLEEQVKSISLASMGADVADITGDGYPEVFVTEMLAETNERLKTNVTFDDWEYHQYFARNGSWYQFIRNTLLLSNGVVQDRGLSFSEVGRQAGVEATDWSWTALIFDLNNDSFNDLYVTNGIYRDILDRDYTKYISRPRKEFFKVEENKTVVDINRIIGGMPSTPLSNYSYSKEVGIKFVNRAAEWGLAQPGFSNGAAYGDLDNDGDLDLVVNNVNMPAFVYRNETNVRHPPRNYLKVDLKGEGKNTLAVGAKVTLKAGDRMFYLEQVPNRSFQSSVDPRLNFGLGDIDVIDTLLAEWPVGKRTLLTGIRANQTLYLKESEATESVKRAPMQREEKVFKDITAFGPDFRHRENGYNDFESNPMLFHMRSTEGPGMAVADVNGDGREDLYLGGAKGSPGQLFIQRAGGRFTNTNIGLFESDKDSEDTDCLFLDADGDGDLDLYVASGGSEHSVSSASLADRMYLNDGSGRFEKSEQTLPAGRPESTSVVKAGDMDGDGDLDLFVGLRLRAGLVGFPQNGYLLQNDGSGQFKDVTEKVAPDLKNLGMITGAAWSDYDQDGDIDLTVVGEWMEVKLFANDGSGRFTEKTKETGLTGTTGIWNTIEAADIDGDGDTDFIAGNLGLNSRFRVGEQKPMTWYSSDFDRNGTIEQIITAYNGEKPYPLISRDELVSRLPGLQSKYPSHDSFKDQTAEDIFSPSQLKEAVVHRVRMLESILLMNEGDGTFTVQKLPWQAQVSPVYAILVNDFDGDGISDVLLGGNLHNVKPEIGRYDASYGVFLKGIGSGNFRSIPAAKSGLMLDGEIRDLSILNVTAGKPKVLVARNNDKLQVLEFQ